MDFDIFIKGLDIDLVVVSEEMVSKTNWFRWFNDESITVNMQKHYFPITPSMQMEYFKNCIEGAKDKLQCGIWHKSDEILIGMVALSNIDFHQRKCEISGIIGEKKYQKLKYIIESLKLLMKHSFDQLNMHRLYGGSINRQVADMMIRLLGFREEGVWRQDVYKNGKYNDVFCIGILREEFEAFLGSGG